MPLFRSVQLKWINTLDTEDSLKRMLAPAGRAPRQAYSIPHGNGAGGGIPFGMC